jgi:hypothetical protein
MTQDPINYQDLFYGQCTQTILPLPRGGHKEVIGRKEAQIPTTTSSSKLLAAIIIFTLVRCSSIGLNWSFARSSPTYTSAQRTTTPIDNNKINMARRGSSMFVPPGAGAGGGLAPPSPDGAGQGPPPGAQKGRGSVVMQPMAGGIGLVDFDSDYESDEEQAPQQTAVPGVSGASKPDDRPMVGGFAAAAYEAAKAFHAQQKAKKDGAPAAEAPKRSGRPQQS